MKNDCTYANQQAPRYLRLLQTFAGDFQKKIRTRETTMNYISVKRLLNAELDKIISYVSYPSPNTKEAGKQ